MHVILLTIGTDGDILPFVGLGSTLRQRGHRVILASSEDYRGLATRYGLDFAPLLSAEEMRALLANPDFWHPTRTIRLSAQWGLRFIERQYELVRKLASPDDAVFGVKRRDFCGRPRSRNSTKAPGNCAASTVDDSQFNRPSCDAYVDISEADPAHSPQGLLAAHRRNRGLSDGR